MKLYIDTESDSLHLVFNAKWEWPPIKIAPDACAFLAADGEVAAILIDNLSRLTGGRRISDLTFDFTPPESPHYEFTPEETERLSRKLAERGITWPAPAS